MTKKKLLFPMVSFLLLMVVFAFTANISLFAEEKKSGDISDISLDELLNVEITTAGKQAEKISEIPASVVVVTRADIEKYGYTTLGEILANIPGLYYLNDYLYSSLGVRGFWTVDPNRNMVILVNDVKQTEGIFNANLMEQLGVTPEAIDRIEVVRGPMSVMYGSGAFFGVINIKTNLMSEKDPNNMVSVSLGTQKSSRVFARTAGKSGDFQYTFNGSYNYTQGIDADLEKMVGPSMAGMSTKGILNKNEKYFNFSGKFKDFSFDASYIDGKDGFIFLLPTVGDGGYNRTNVTRLGLGYDKSISEKIKMEAKLGYFRNTMFFVFDFVAPNIYANQDFRTSGVNAELNFFVTPNPKINLVMGLNYNRNFDYKDMLAAPLIGYDYYNTELAEGSAIQTEAAFAQLNYKVSDKFKFVAGARIEKTPAYTMQLRVGSSGFQDITQKEYSQTKVQFIPRLAFIYSLNDTNVVKLLYGKAINNPSFFQNADLVYNVNATPLIPERIDTFELNYVGSFSSKLSVSLSLFRNMLDKLIYRSQFFVGGKYVSYFANVGKMDTNGLELTVTALPVKQFQLELSATYQDTKDKRDGFGDIKPGYSPKFLGYLKAAVFFSKDITLAVTGNYVGKMESYYDSTTLSRLGDPVDAYFLLGANLRFNNLFDKGVFLNFRASNLLNKDVFYPATSNNNLFAKYGTIGEKFTFLATLGWKF